jgi:SWI/SNF-related matrix-associated actin-dependent regulator of chromatin subfamily A3
MCPAKRALSLDEEPESGFSPPLPRNTEPTWTDTLQQALGTSDLLDDGGDYTSAICEDVCLPFQPGPLSAFERVGHSIEIWNATNVLLLEPDKHIGPELNLASSKGLPSSRTISEELFCFGMVHEVPARLLGHMQDLRSSLMARPANAKTMRLAIHPERDFLKLVSEDNTDVGQLCETATKPFNKVMEFAGVRLEGFIDLNVCIQCIDKAKRLHDAVFKIDINVYGPASARNGVGAALEVSQIYLQDTVYDVSGYSYDNPHMLSFPEIPTDAVLSSAKQDNGLDESVAELAKRISQSETKDRGLQGLDPIAKVLSPLMQHQKQALEFMVQRETGKYPEDFRLWQHMIEAHRSGYRHAITGTWATSPEEEHGYGILADDMGMGKTLSTLCLIAERLEQARVWCDTQRLYEGIPKTSQATLVVLPSLVIMDEWTREIELHFGNNLKVGRYHGKGRDESFFDQMNVDIVLTTYHTLAADQKAKRLTVRGLRWFRLVLDEAHIIRHQKTKLFAAVAELESLHRWCLSGTPIQNRLEDLGSLLAFIRAVPLNDATSFRRSVISPFLDDRQGAVDRLRQLLSSVCLRRSLDRLHLLPLREEVKPIQLSPAERAAYDNLQRSMVRALTHGHRERWSKNGQFQIQLQLRLICSHGTFQTCSTDVAIQKQMEAEDAASLAGAEKMVLCARCHFQTILFATNCTASAHCSGDLPIICDECAAEESGSVKTFMRQEQPTGHTSGFSSKINTLVCDLLSDLQTTKRFVRMADSDVNMLTRSVLSSPAGRGP